jgi:hypothetical protein
LSGTEFGKLFVLIDNREYIHFIQEQIVHHENTQGNDVFVLKTDEVLLHASKGTFKCVCTLAGSEGDIPRRMLIAGKNRSKKIPDVSARDSLLI